MRLAKKSGPVTREEITSTRDYHTQPPWKKATKLVWLGIAATLYLCISATVRTQDIVVAAVALIGFVSYVLTIWYSQWTDELMDLLNLVNRQKDQLAHDCFARELEGTIERFLKEFGGPPQPVNQKKSDTTH